MRTNCRLINISPRWTGDLLGRFSLVQLGCRRSAISLLEVMVVTAVSTVIMGAVIFLAIALKQRDHAVRKLAVESERQSELAETLRSDIRLASDVSLPAETLLVVTAPDGRQMRYELAASGCRRTVVEPGVTAPRVELFLVGAAALWELDNGPAGRRPLRIVTLRRPVATVDARASGMPLLVYAALGADLPPAPTMY
jgi:hypothetical protein